MLTRLNFFTTLALAGLASPVWAQVPDGSGVSTTDGWELPQVPPAAPGAQGLGSGEPAFKGPATSSALASLPTVFRHSLEFHWEDTDVDLPGINGNRLSWVRTYRSREGRSTPMGEGWDHSFNVYLVPEKGPLAKGMILCDGTGYQHRMRPSDQDPSVLCEPGFSATLRQELDGSWTLLFADGGRWSLHAFDESPIAGKLERSIDRNGNQVRLSYNPAGQLVSLQDTQDRVTTVQYGAQGRIASVTDPVGRRFSYGYSAQGDLETVTSPAVLGTPNGNDYPSGKTTTYSYSKGFAEEALNHNLLSIENGAGQIVLTNEYGTSKRPRHFDRLQRQTRGGPGKISDYRLFSIGTADAVAGEVMTTVENDPEGNVSHHSFDGRNRPVLVERFTGQAKPKQPSTLTHNRPGAKLRASDPDSYVTRMFWSEDDRNTLVVLPGGNMVERVFQYDIDPGADPRTRGNLRELRRIAGLMGGSQQELVEFFEYVEDPGAIASNLVKRYIDPKGSVTEHAYDSSGNRTRTIYPVAGLDEEWQHDQRGRVVLHLHAETSPQQRKRDAFVYFPEQGGAEAGRLQQVISDVEGLALTTTLGYGPYGNIASVIDARGADRQTIFNELNQPVVRLSREATPGAGDRAETRYWIGPADRLVRKDEKWSGEDTGFEERWVSSLFDYNSMDCLRRRYTEEGGVELTGREYSYDKNGKLASSMTGISGGPKTQRVEIEYDERRLVWRQIAAPGAALETVTESSYDANGFLSRRVMSSDEGIWEDQLADYDGFGRRILSTDALSGTQIERTFGPNGNLGLEQVRAQLVADADPGDMVLMARRSWSHDKLNRQVQATVKHIGLSTGNAIGDGLSVRQTQWAGLGLVSAVIDDLGGVTRYGYDTAQRRIARTDQKGDRVEYVLDGNGNKVLSTTISGSDLGGQPEIRSYLTEYDGRDQMISRLDPMQAGRYWVRNIRGQLTSRVDERGNKELYFYNALGCKIRSEQVLTASGSGGSDEVGRIIRSRTFDEARRMTSCTDANGNVTSFAFDELDNVSARTLADGSVQRSTYSGPALMQTVDANGTTIAYQYEAGRLAARMVVQAGPGVFASDEHFKRDGLGRLVSGSDADSLVELERDSMGNTVKETLTIGAGPEALSGVTTMTFDGEGGLTSLNYPSGRSLSYQVRHVAGQAQVTSITEEGKELASIAYLGNRVEEVLQYRRLGQLQLRSSFGYGPRGWLTGEQHSGGAFGLPVAAFDHELDAVGNLVGFEDQMLQRSHSMSYDSGERLVGSQHDRAGGVDEELSYDLDHEGNRLQVVGGSGAGAYWMDAASPPSDLQVNQYSTTPKDVRLYSDTGNLITCIPMQEAPLMNFFDHRGRAVQMDLSPTSSKHLRYDVFGRLVQEVLFEGGEPSTTSFFYAGTKLVEERDDDDEPGGTAEPVTWIWFRDSGVSAPISMRSASGEDFALATSPKIGVVAAVDSAGVVQERYGYGDYGQVLDAETSQPIVGSGVGNRFFFKGQQTDLDLGHILSGEQRIDPLVGRSINRAGGMPDMQGSGASNAWPDDWEMPWLTVASGITNNRPWKPVNNAWPDDWTMPWLAAAAGITNSPIHNGTWGNNVTMRACSNGGSTKSWSSGATDSGEVVSSADEGLASIYDWEQPEVETQADTWKIIDFKKGKVILWGVDVGITVNVVTGDGNNFGDGDVKNTEGGTKENGTQTDGGTGSTGNGSGGGTSEGGGKGGGDEDPPEEPPGEET